MRAFKDRGTGRFLIRCLCEGSGYSTGLSIAFALGSRVRFWVQVWAAAPCSRNLSGIKAKQEPAAPNPRVSENLELYV